MVSHLIALAGREGGADRKLELLRMANERRETALHDAVRVEEKSMVKLLMDADPGLANYPANGISPLYLAISLRKDTIAVTLYKMSGGNLSYFGLDGQNALHAAVLLVTVMIEEVLKWNKGLATQVDKHGSTPLHFASSRSDFFIRRRLWIRIPIYWSLNIVAKVFEANPTALYQADNSGLFPIHVAASVGATKTIEFFLQESPNCAGLRNAKGRTFLHVAVEKRRHHIISSGVCHVPSVQWILNMQDKDGNTALHLAMERKMVKTCCDLLANEKVHLNLSNVKGQTPLDLSRINLPRGMHYPMNSESKMHQALELFGAKHNCLRCDHIEDKYERPLDPEEEKKQSDMIKDATEMFIVGAVLIATVAFGATFAIPGGYKADDHLNGGTPTLAGRFIFDAFMMANTLAFVCSTVGIISLVLSGTSMVDMSTRRWNLVASLFLLSSSITSMTVAFALAAYLVLAPVARSTAIAIFVLSPLPMLYRHLVDGIHIWLLVIQAQYGRKRPLGIVLMKLARLVFWFMVWELWPVVVTFAWAGFARRDHH
ncbi:hypothetical protein HU200_057269 [Digitaria exilis]|uniref:PGG domain-containing protein n=1 Tax=Digitaria exilis TaxID=1010633 RepID=A0A835AFZ9_9POAL|nr:hypothetical protein HU200_057269 [Digitaria exilis]